MLIILSVRLASTCMRDRYAAAARLHTNQPQNKAQTAQDKSGCVFCTPQVEYGVWSGNKGSTKGGVATYSSPRVGRSPQLCHCHQCHQCHQCHSVSSVQQAAQTPACALGNHWSRPSSVTKQHMQQLWQCQSICVIKCDN